MKKLCKCCNKIHTKPVNIIGNQEGYIWFNCECGSTLVTHTKEKK